MRLPMISSRSLAPIGDIPFRDSNISDIRVFTSFQDNKFSSNNPFNPPEINLPAICKPFLNFLNPQCAAAKPKVPILPSMDLPAHAERLLPLISSRPSATCCSLIHSFPFSANNTRPLIPYADFTLDPSLA